MEWARSVPARLASMGAGLALLVIHSEDHSGCFGVGVILVTYGVVSLAVIGLVRRAASTTERPRGVPDRQQTGAEVADRPMSREELAALAARALVAHHVDAVARLRG